MEDDDDDSGDLEMLVLKDAVNSSVKNKKLFYKTCWPTIFCSPKSFNLLECYTIASWIKNLFNQHLQEGF